MEAGICNRKYTKTEIPDLHRDDSAGRYVGYETYSSAVHGARPPGRAPPRSANITFTVLGLLRARPAHVAAPHSLKHGIPNPSSAVLLFLVQLESLTPTIHRSQRMIDSFRAPHLAQLVTRLNYNGWYNAATGRGQE